MSFRLGDIIVKEIMYGYVSECSANGTGMPLYVISQLTNATITPAHEENDITDKNGSVVKSIPRAKTAELSATNAFLNGNIIEAASGSKAEFASEDGKIVFPKIITGKPGEKIDVTDHVEGTIKVNAYYADGTMGAGVAAETVTAAIAENKLTLPEAIGDAPLFVVKFMRQVSEGAVIRNKADAFPESTDILLKIKYYDPCNKNLVKPGYVHGPSFILSPDTALSLDPNEPTMEYNGKFEVDYCSTDKILYELFLPGDEYEEE